MSNVIDLSRRRSDTFGAPNEGGIIACLHYINFAKKKIVPGKINLHTKITVCTQLYVVLRLRQIDLQKEFLCIFFSRTLYRAEKFCVQRSKSFRFMQI